MTREFKCLMYIVGCTSKGSTVGNTSIQGVDWKRLFQLATEQEVSFLLTYALRRRNDLGCPEELRSEWTAQMFETLIKAGDQKKKVLELLAELETADFQPILLKGYVLSDCYAVKDCRISSDVDILIPPNKEARVCACLKKRGFEVLPRYTNGHHSVCTHPDYGYLEIHAELFDRLVADVWFRDLDEKIFDLQKCVRMGTTGGSYITLGYTDNLLFMTLHMVKHFINGGISLRMMLDIALFIIKYRERIDFQQYWDVLHAMSYDVMVSSVLWALIRYSEFDVSEFPKLPDENVELVEMLLSDLEQGGGLGKNTPDEGRESHAVYSAYMQRKGSGNYQLSILKQEISTVMRRVFPARVVLAQYLPASAENAMLIPVAWCRHALHGVNVIFREAARRNRTSGRYCTEQRGLGDRTLLLKKMQMM